MRWAQKVNALWYEKRYRCLFYLLLPLSGLFFLMVHLRRFFYLRFFPPHKEPFPFLIVVGNISVGGTGKTPFVLALIHLLQKQGLSVGLIARGYHSQAEYAAAPVEVTRTSSPEKVGDEPCLIVRRAGVPAMVHRKRAWAFRQLIQLYPHLDIVLSDDGLQHLALARDFEVVLVDSHRRFGNAAVLPAGPLREPLSRLSTVNAVVVNGEDFHLQARRLISLSQMGSEKKEKKLSWLKGKTVHAVAGIAHPQRFFDTLTALGAELILHIFPDHALFNVMDFACFQDELIVMTEKDAVKCENFAFKQAYYLEVDAVLTPAFQDAFLEKLQYTRQHSRFVKCK